MKRPNFNENTAVKIIDKKNALYGERGAVTAVNGYNDTWTPIPKPYTPENYPARWKVFVKLNSCGAIKEFADADNELEVVQHKFIDIDYIREEDIDLGTLKPDGTKAIRPKNTGAFEPGDIIQISTKIDGANASIAWDETTGKLEIFSRTNLLDSPGALRGFYDYIKTEVEPLVEKWDGYKNLVFFGEWCVSHTVQYNKDWYNKWRIYDIYGKKTGTYLPQDFVKHMCKILGLEYIEELYYGPFISWDHCRSFLNKSTAYGSEQEGIVIKNQSKLGDENNRAPAYLKIVNEKFKESQHSKKEKKPVDPEAEAAKAEAAKLAASIVTEARIRKLILKLVDEGKLPAELKPTDMGAVMKQLPRLVFNDVVKEESETVKLLGEYAGKSIAAETAKQARKIIIGS